MIINAIKKIKAKFNGISAITLLKDYFSLIDNSKESIHNPLIMFKL